MVGTKNDPALIEHLSRAVCAARGIDPDKTYVNPETGEYPEWRRFQIHRVVKDYLAMESAALEWMRRHYRHQPDVIDQIERQIEEEITAMNAKK